MSTARRIAEYTVTFIIIISLNFILPRALPGDPLLRLSSDSQDVMLSVTEEQRSYYQEYYQLDLPLHRQYTEYLKGIAKLDLGSSIVNNKPVLEIIGERLPWTLLLVLSSLLLSTVVGALLGALSAFSRNSAADRIIYFKMIFLSEIPSFMLGIMMLFVFAVNLKLFPLFGAYSYYHNYASAFEHIKDIAYHAALPIITLSVSRLSGIYFLTRNSVISIMSKEFLRTAQAKGLSNSRIIVFHALRNALLPVVTRVFLSLGGMIGGTILVENVFAYPGMGTLIRETVTDRDYPLIQGLFLIVTLLTISANLISDIVYKRLDPRLR